MTKTTETRLTGIDTSNEPTADSRDVLDFVRDFLRDSASGGAIAEHLGLESSKLAARLVRDLEAQGAVINLTASSKRNALAIALPDRLDRAVRAIAQRARTTPEEVVIEAVDKRLSGISEALEATASPTRRTTAFRT